jgi:TP901 family phage tail tape measure protein
MANKSTYELEVRLGASTSASWTAALSKAEKGLDGLNNVADKVAAGIAAGVTAAAATAALSISEAAQTYEGFEQEMATVKSISEATESEYTELKEAALEAGRSTIYTAEESASALEYMSLAGWSVQDSIDGLTPMLKLAAATGKELQTTSDLVTDSMSALGIGVGDLDEYLDKLAKANNKSNTSAEQLMEALIKSGGASKVLGASLDDTITSLGILANNGVKAEEAGTALNAVMVRLAGNSQAINELSNLKVDIWDGEGNFIGWQESLEKIEEAMEGLTDEQKALSLKNLAGTTHYTQFEYLLESVRETTDGSENAWNQLEAQVEQSSGALDDMYDTTTNTLEYAIARLNAAKEDMQINFMDVFSDDARDFINWLAERLPVATDALAEFATEHQRDFADMLEGAEGAIETLWENGITAGEWLINNRGALAGGLKAVAAQIIAIKAATAGVKIAQLLTNPLTALPIAAAAAGVGIGLFVGHLDDLAEAAKDADLEGRFGDIALSMDDIEAAASRIVGSSSLTGVLESLEQFGRLDGYQEQIDDAVEALNKYNWKVSIGLELTEDENETYKSEIKKYAKAAQEYALQAQYAVQLSMAVTFDDSGLEENNIVTKVNAFYSDKYGELEALGTSLNEAVTNAFNDGLLDIDEVKEISEIQRQMADIQSQLAVGEMDAQLALMEQEYTGIRLTPESYEALEGKLSEQVDSAMESYNEAFVKNYQAITNTYQNGEGENAMTEEEYDGAIEALKEEYASQKAAVSLKALQFELNTINEGYGGEIEQYIQTVLEAFEKYDGQEQDWEERPFAMWEGVIQDVLDNGIDSASKDAVNELLVEMEPAIQSLYDIMENDWGSLDSETQDTVTEAVRNIELLQAMASEGDTQALYRDVANRAAETEGESSVKTYVEESYGELTDYKTATDEAYRAFEDYAKETAEPVIEGMYAWSQEQIDQYFAQGFTAESDLDITLNPYFSTGTVTTAVTRSLFTGSKLYSNAEGGIYDSPILTTFAEEGPEAAIPLDGSARAVGLWTRAGEILGTITETGGTSTQERLSVIRTDESRDTRILHDVIGGVTNNSQNVSITFNPSVTIQGSATKEDVQGALSLTLDELRNMINEIQRENQRVSFR